MTPAPASPAPASPTPASPVQSRPPGRRRRGGHGTKIVVTGPFAAGKTTLIRAVSEITVLSTEKDVTDATRARKAETTVAMDFGRITLSPDLVLHLFGTPGQDRFDFMWDILGEGMLGYVILVDGTDLASWADAAAIRLSFARSAPAAPFVVAVNRVEAVDPATVARLRGMLQLPGFVPVVPCDVTDRESVKEVLLALLHEALHALDPVPPPVTGPAHTLSEV